MLAAAPVANEPTAAVQPEAERPPDRDPPAGQEPNRSPTFSLPEAIAYALRHSPRLRAAAAVIGRAQGLEQVAFAPFLPQVDLFTRVAATNRNQSPGPPSLTGSVLGPPEVSHLFGQAEVQLQWTLYDFGRTAGRYHQALSRERIAELQLARAKETVALDVAVAYRQGLLAAASCTIQEEAIRRAEATLGDVRVRREAGVADRDDVLRAEVQLSEARDGLIVAREAELAALARLNTVMGRNASLPLRLTDEREQPAFELSLPQCLEVAARQRPEVGAAREAVAVAQFGRQAAAAEFCPRVYMLASLGAVDGANVQSGIQQGAGLHLTQPLYGGGRRRGDLNAATADVAEALANAQTLLDNISLEVTLAHRSVVAARARIDLAEPAVAEARENLRLVATKYRNGNATPTDIVDAEAALTRAQQRYWSATYEYLTALARLRYAMGEPQGEPTPVPDGLPPPPPH